MGLDRPGLNTNPCSTAAGVNTFAAVSSASASSKMPPASKQESAPSLPALLAEPFFTEEGVDSESRPCPPPPPAAAEAAEGLFPFFSSESTTRAVKVSPFREEPEVCSPEGAADFKPSTSFFFFL